MNPHVYYTYLSRVPIPTQAQSSTLHYTRMALGLYDTRYDIMPRLSLDARRRVVTFFEKGMCVKDIQKRLEEENVSVTRQTLYRLIRKFETRGMIADLPRRKRSRKITSEMLEIIDSELQQNDELTSQQLRSHLQERFPSLHVSLPTIKRARKAKGWVCTRPHYCQVVRDLNKRKRFLWCHHLKNTNENIVFTDECTVQLERHSRLCFRKQRQYRVLKPTAKHPVKLHVWGGISSRGATSIVMFSGIMDAPRYQQILEAGLLPFLSECFPDGHRFQQDNDPKHCSNHIGKFFTEQGVVWWRTPPESPDLNPIENVWGSMKQYLRTIYKPRNLETLKEGIQQFWNTLTPEVCRRYINHLNKVVPKVIEVRGEPSGY